MTATRRRAHAVAVRVVVAGVAPEAVTAEPGEKTGEEEHDDVHDGEGPAGLEHGTGFAGGPVPGAGGDDAQGGEVTVPIGVAGDVVAAGIADVAQGVDRADEGADEEGIHDGDPGGVGGGAVVAEEGEDGPG